LTGLTRILAIATVILTAGRGVCAGETGVDPKDRKMPSPVRLRIAATTTVEIALAWDPVPGATAYTVQRSTGPSFDPATTMAFELPPEVAGYGDLGCGPYEASRFGPGHHVKEFDRQNLYSDGRGGRGGAQYYRLKVRLKVGGEMTSETMSARLADKPVRGEKGDLWADVVLGQPDFYNYNNGIEHPPQRQDGCQMLLGRTVSRAMSCVGPARIVLLGTIGESRLRQQGEQCAFTISHLVYRGHSNRRRICCGKFFRRSRF